MAERAAVTRRVLLDENVDRLLRALFDPAFEVVTARERGWDGKKNGELLRAAAAEFDVFVTMDRNLPHQQNLRVLDLAVVVIRSRSNAFLAVAPLMDRVNEAIRTAEAGAATIVAG